MQWLTLRFPSSPRLEFDTDRSPDLNKDVYLQDIHCVSSLCKAYFRELPNPLLTYQLYDKFAVRMAGSQGGEEPGGGTPSTSPRPGPSQCHQIKPGREKEAVPKTLQA